MSIIDTSDGQLRIAVGIATAGRPAVVSRTIAELSKQVRSPDLIVVCSPNPDDLTGLPTGSPMLKAIVGQRGLTNQRNAILETLPGFDIVVFFDDDFVPCPRYLEQVEAVFKQHPDVMMTTGRVLADGILGQGLDFETAATLLSQDSGADPHAEILTPVGNGYGCNMAARLAPVFEHNLRFDENLPLYAWLEDVDFSRQLARFGRIVKVETTRGVHLGVKSGRQSGTRLGYSQIVNPVYLVRKGTCPWRHAAFLMSRNIAANLLRSMRPEPYVDRVGRLQGNVRALMEILVGRAHPTRILGL